MPSPSPPNPKLAIDAIRRLAAKGAITATREALKGIQRLEHTLAEANALFCDCSIDDLQKSMVNKHNSELPLYEFLVQIDEDGDDGDACHLDLYVKVAVRIPNLDSAEFWSYTINGSPR